MEKFAGKAHLPGADKEWDIEMEIDWDEKEIYVHITGAPGGVKTWTGLVPQTFGNYEIAFRTRGIPPLLTHWWHLVRRNGGYLWGMVIGLPNVTGEWSTCVISLKKPAKLGHIERRDHSLKFQHNKEIGYEKPSGAGNKSVSFTTCRQSSGLVSLGRRSLQPRPG